MKYKDDGSDAIDRLKRNGIGVDGRVVILDSKHPPGIKLWGTVDFLKSKFGFRTKTKTER